MNITRRAALGLASTMLLGRRALSQGKPASADDRMVVVMTIDGLPARAWEDINKFAVPTLRRLQAEGAFAKAMTTINPCMTLPNHTSIVTGTTPARHGVVCNGVPTFIGEDGPVRLNERVDKETFVLAPTVYDLAFQHGLRTAEVNWVAIDNAKTINWSFPQRPKLSGTIEQELIAEKIVSSREISQWLKMSHSWMDHVRTQAAIQIVKKHKPNLLLFHLEMSDGMNHLHGQGSHASQLAYTYIDSCLRDLIGAIRTAGILDKTTIFVTSDHGFKTASRLIRPNAVLHEMGLLKESGGSIVCQTYATTFGGSAMLWIRNRARYSELASSLKERFRKVEGVADILEPNSYAQYGMPHPKNSSRIGDLMLLAKDGYAFWGGNEGPGVVDLCGYGDPGHHTYLSSDTDMDATFLAWGNGIRPGIQIDRVRNLDVAPTVASLLGLTMNDVEGRVLGEILTPSGSSA